ncbi:hypothetical protein TNCV_2027851 [Trichonephila clavipes]|nr:hypothetical protein TNCV_2027851 [Trichonephila clavipes]
MALITRAFEETELHYHNHLSCYRSQKSTERFKNTQLVHMRLIYGLREGKHKQQNDCVTEGTHREMQEPPDVY